MRVILLTGKGGVGKTTTAAATGLHAARRGTKTLVLSTDPAHSLADALGVPVGAEPTEVEPGLFAQHADPRTRMDRAWQGVREYLLGVLDAVGVEPVAAEELTVLPGVDDVLALLELRDQVRTGPWDLVVVDCGATAETLRLLALPESLSWYLDAAVPAERRIARAVRPVLERAGGLPLPSEAVLGAVDRLRRELTDVHAVLTAPTTSVRVVLTPEAVAVAEARRTLTSLALFGFAVDGVVVNRLVPDGADPWRSAWARTQAEQLSAVRAAVGSLPVVTGPYLPAEPVGVDALADLAGRLYPGGAAAGDPLAVASVPPPVQVQRDGQDFVLELRLPDARGEDVDLARDGDDLVVTVGPYRRHLTLPSALRRCDVQGAALRKGVLGVRFRPDPALWRTW
ncbi:ArsA family ATPase [Quadrisphaera sp. GCM10027208]|uniref:ArsA family ATPase n=1 Tax=Quadrisphaera sp. GCM10027208 TaxID=3273423 RepID=UPI00361B69A6